MGSGSGAPETGIGRTCQEAEEMMGTRWTPDEDAQIMELWESDRPTKSAVPEFPGRTVEAIRKRAAILGLPDKRTAPSVFPNKAREFLMSGRRATAKEIFV
jgi:hypothetical protein